MKTIFRFFGLAVVVAGVGVSAASAQEACANVDDQTAVYTKVTENYNSKSVDQLKIALASGKEFLEKYGACTALKPQIDFVQPQVSRLEKAIPEIIGRQELGAMFTRYDNGVQGKKYDEAFAAGRDILAKQPENLNILVPLGVIGLYQSYDKNFKYNDDSIRYAQKALQLIKSGTAFPKKNKAGVPTAGVFEFEYPKEDAVSELTYALGYINYYAKNDKKAAIPYYYEVSQLPGRYKSEPRVYATIGSYYAEEGGKVGQELAALIAKQKAAPTEAEKAAIEPEIQAKLGIFNAYTERIIDAYARAHMHAKSAKVPDKAYTDSLYKILQDTYRRRFDKIEGLDAYLAATIAKPLPNPTSAITPVVDPEPVKTTGAVKPVSALPATNTETPAAVKTAAVAAVVKPSSTTPTAAVKPVPKAPVRKAVTVKKRVSR